MDTIAWTIDDILTATGGELLSGRRSSSFEGVSIDSRNISKSDLFVAIKGERHDGHRFIPDVITAGIRGMIIDRRLAGRQPIEDWQQKHITCIAVDDTIRALGDMAAWHRRRFNFPVAAITGSNGKTTTRAMAAAVAGQKLNILSTFGNLNNEIGVPLTLFRLTRSHEAAVLELGMNHPGEIRRLGKMCQPDFGLITNIGPAHLEGLGAIEDVMTAKAELLENIKEDGTIVLNGDDALCLKIGASTDRNVIYFGRSRNSDIRAVNTRIKGIGSAFTLELPEESIEVELSVPGQFMVANALAAAAMGCLFGCSGEEIKAGLEAFTPVQGRMNFKQTQRGFFLIDDTYNANPDSMEAAIQTLVSLKEQKKKVLVAGDMLELGSDAESLHERIGRIAVKSGVARLYLTGDYAASVAKGAQNQGMPDADIIKGNKGDLVKALNGFLCPGDCVLVKGSRGAGMEEIVRQLEASVESV